MDQRCFSKKLVKRKMSLLAQEKFQASHQSHIRQCVRTIFIHELRSIRKRTASERSERVSFLIRNNE